MLTKIQYEILTKLDSEYSYGFSWFDDLGLTRKELSAEFKVLRKIGLVEYQRGLLNDDGEVAGSGYGLPYGRKADERLGKLLKEYEEREKGANSSQD